jgi:type II secretory pathway predicted ATPase ExeA
MISMRFDLVTDDSTELDARIKLIDKPRFILHGTVKRYLDMLADLLTTQTPKHYILTGVPGNGKTALARYFQKRHAPRMCPDEDAASVPVILATMPEISRVGDFGEELLGAMMEASPKGCTATEKFRVAKCLIRNLGVKVIFLDEFAHLNTGSVTERAGMRNAVKRLADECEASIVALGIPVALGILSQESQLQRRFRPLVLPPWTADDAGRSLLHQLECNLGLNRSSDIANNLSLCTHILDQSDGVLEYIVEFMRAAGKHAIITGREKIDRTLVDSMGWVKKSEYTKLAARNLNIVPRTIGIH